MDGIERKRSAAVAPVRRREQPARPVASSRGLLRSFAAPEGKVYLLYGDPAVFRLSHRIGAHILGDGATVALVDGANRFDIHAVVRFAQEQNLNPDELLCRLYISRGFTCYQVEAAVTERLPAFLRRAGSRTALIYGLLDTFYDEQAPLRDVRLILDRVLEALQQLRKEGVSVLLVSADWRVLPEARNRLLDQLKGGMDRVYRLETQGERAVQLYLERDEQPAGRPLAGRGGGRYGKNRTDIHEHP